MPCYHPTRVHIDRYDQLDWSKDWRSSDAFGRGHMNVACGDCLGCNKATQRSWSIRAFHESLLHTKVYRDPITQVATTVPHSCVVTLTYDEDHLPADRSLKHADFQRFMKRLRIKRAREGHEKPIRFFMCGEYGGKTQRPHFHAILFGESFDDRYTEHSLDGQANEMSYELDELWSQPIRGTDTPTKIGRATVDSFSFAAAAYVAGYVAKKSSTEGHQGPIETIVDTKTGEVIFRPIQREYRKMSTRPSGLGAEWLLKPGNLERIYSADTVQISKWKFHPPKYYDVLLKRENPTLHAKVVSSRKERMSAHAEEWDQKRCADAEASQLTSLQQRSDSL